MSGLDLSKRSEAELESSSGRPTGPAMGSERAPLLPTARASSNLAGCNSDLGKQKRGSGMEHNSGAELRAAGAGWGSRESLLGGSLEFSTQVRSPEAAGDLELPFGGSRLATKLASYTSEPAQTLELMRQWAQMEAALLEQEQHEEAQQAQQAAQQARQAPQQSGLDGAQQPGQQGATTAADAFVGAEGATAGSPFASKLRVQVPSGSHSAAAALPRQGAALATSPLLLGDAAGPEAAMLSDFSVSPLPAIGNGGDPLDDRDGGGALPRLESLRTFSTLQNLDRQRPGPLGRRCSAGVAGQQQAPTQHAQAQQQRKGVRRRLGVQLLADPLAEERGVHYHQVAGDLFLAPERGKASDSLAAFRIPPLPPDMVKDVLQLDTARKVRSPTKARRNSIQPARRDEADKGEEGEKQEIDFELGEEEQSKPVYRKRGFWKCVILVTITMAFLLAGVFMAAWQKQERLETWFSWWRLLIFIATLIPIWYLGTFFGRAILWVTESRFFEAENLLFFIYAVRKPLVNVVRSGLLMASWAACMYESSFSDRDTSSTIQSYYNAYNTILKLCGCLLLFFLAELLKVLFAKMIANKFNRESHVRKMQAALRKERYLHELLRPKERPWEVEMEAELLAAGKAGGLSEAVGTKLAGSPKGSSGGSTQGGQELSAPLDLVRRSAPNPVLTHGRRSFRSLLALGGTRRRSLSLPGVAALDPIAEEHEEGAPEMVLNIESPPRGSSPSTPCARPPSGPRSPTRGLPGRLLLPLEAAAAPAGGAAAGVPYAAVQVQRSSQPGSPSGLRGGSEAAGKPGRQQAGSPDVVATAAKDAGSAAQLGGLLKQGSRALGSLFKQGSPDCGGAAPGSPSRQPAAVARQSVQSGASDGPAGRAASSTSAGGKARALQRSVAMTKEKPKATLESASTINLAHRGPMAIAAKMARVEKHIRKRKLQLTFYDELGQISGHKRVTNENEAKRLAFFIFHNVKTDFDRPFITIEDLEAFLPTEKEAQEAFLMLDSDGNGRVTLAKCAQAVMDIFQEREYLAASLRDTKNIVNKLGFMIGIGLHIVFFFVYLIILGLDAWNVFVAVVPVLGAVSFALGSSVKQAVDNSVFLFVTHPYDVGDIIVFNNSWHKVEEITLPCTVLLRTADSAKIWYPNSQLINIPLHNLTMSPPLAEITTFYLDGTAPLSVVDDVKVAVTKYCLEHSLDFTGKVNTWYAPADDPLRPNRLTLSVKVEYNYGMLNARCFPARGALCHFILTQLAELKVEVTNVVQPVSLRGPGAFPNPHWLTHESL